MAEELSGQAEVLAQAISFFRLGTEGSNQSLAKPRDADLAGKKREEKAQKPVRPSGEGMSPGIRKGAGTRSTGIAVREKDDHRAAMAHMDPEDMAFEEF